MRFLLPLSLLLLIPALLSSAHRILVYNSKFAHSHINYMGRVADLLVEAGHSVTTLLPDMIPELGNGTAKSTIVRVAPPPIIAETYKPIGEVDYFTVNFKNPFVTYEVGKVFATVFTAQCEATLDSGVVEQLRERRFDVYIVETYDPCGMMLAHLIKPRSVILQSTLFLWMQQLDEVGIDRSLSYNPSVETSHLNVNSFWSRLGNVYADYVLSMYPAAARSSIDRLFKKRFGPDYPSLREQSSRVTFVFTNSEPLYDFAVPTLNKVVHLPGLGARDPKPLDKEWSDVMAKRAKAVLISFGSLPNITLMEQDFKQSFIKVFNAFPDVTFIIKYNDLNDDYARNELSKLDNVKLTTWMPQNDLLNDPRLALFLTHCGMGSVQELTMRGKPGLFVPLFGDQMRNAFMLEQAGVGVLMPKAHLAVPDKFIAAVKEALENEKYQKRATEIKQMLDGKPYSSKDLLLKHVDFAGKHGAVAVTRPWSHDMNWIEYHNADVWLFIVSSISLLTLIAIYLSISLVRCCCNCCCKCCKAPANEPHIPTTWRY